MNATLQLKITLADSKPAIWRQITIPAKFSLHALHHAIQISFGWTNSHLYAFTDPWDKEYVLPEDADDSLHTLFPVYSTESVYQRWDGSSLHDPCGSAIAEVLSVPGNELRYIYDYGDNWEHLIRVEAVAEIGSTLPSLAAGENQIPPEDCGGIEAFNVALKLRAKKRKNGEDLEEIETVFGDNWQEFDPQEFDLASHAKALQTQFQKILKRTAKKS